MHNKTRLGGVIKRHLGYNIRHIIGFENGIGVYAGKRFKKGGFKNVDEAIAYIDNL